MSKHGRGHPERMEVRARSSAMRTIRGTLGSTGSANPCKLIGTRELIQVAAMAIAAVRECEHG